MFYVCILSINYLEHIDDVIKYLTQPIMSANSNIMYYCVFILYNKQLVCLSSFLRIYLS